MFTRLATSQRVLLKSFAPTMAKGLRTQSLFSKALVNKNVPLFYSSNFKPKFGEANQGKAYVDVDTKKKTTEEVSADFGLGHYMTNVYKTTGGGVMSSLVIAKLLAMTPLAANPFVFLGGAVISLGGIFSFNRFQPEAVTKIIKGIKVPYAQQPPARWAAYAAIFAGTGMSLAPLVAMADMMNPVIIPMSIALTALTFGGISAYAYNRPLGEFNKWGGVLSGGVFGLIGMSLMSMGSYMIWGPNPFSYAMMTVQPYLALGIFSGLLAYDTHQAIERYQMGDFDHLSASVSIYLDVVNLLSSFIRIVMSFFRDE